jgi:tetratricopeptide (TPR) repeat protein
MEPSSERRSSLVELLELAQIYRSWNRKELARALGRDASKLVPSSGVPKVDLVVGLARVLEWSLGDVVRVLRFDDPDLGGEEVVEVPDASFETLNAAAAKAHREGRFKDMIQLARQTYAVAQTPDQRARACNREAGGWDGLGKYHEALESLQRGLRETEASTDQQLILRSNLSNAYYSLSLLYEGKGVATDVIEELASSPRNSTVARIASAQAYYVRGNCLRCLLEPGQPDEDTLAQHALQDLRAAEEQHQSLAALDNIEAYAASARTCRGAILEVEVILGTRSVMEVLETYMSALRELTDGADWPVGELLESYGWWCIFGCNVALRHMRDPIGLQRTMALFTSKADQIASRLGNWTLRERVLSMEYVRRQRLSAMAGIETEWVINDADVRVIAGAMGRLPYFRKTGWEILRKATIARRS